MLKATLKVGTEYQTRNAGSVIIAETIDTSTKSGRWAYLQGYRFYDLNKHLYKSDGWHEDPDREIMEEVYNPHPHVNNKALRNWIEQEIRLAMQQQAQYRYNGLDRAGVAHVRVGRILAKLDDFHVPDIIEVQRVEIDDYVKSTLPK